VISRQYQHDLWLGHSAKDKAVVRLLPEPLQYGRLRVRLVPPKLPGLGGFVESAQLRLTHPQPSTINHQPASAPLIKERRFIPPRLDGTPIKGSLGQFLDISWRSAGHDHEHEPPFATRQGMRGRGL